MQKATDYLYQRCGGSVTPPIIGSGESIFDYKYLRKFESQIEKGHGNCALDQC
jgi:hypothetical protein